MISNVSLDYVVDPEDKQLSSWKNHGYGSFIYKFLFFFLGVVVVFVVIVEFFDKTIIICQVYFRALKLEDLQ